MALGQGYVPNLGGLAPGCTPTWGMPAKRMRTPWLERSPPHHSHVPPPSVPPHPSLPPLHAPQWLLAFPATTVLKQAPKQGGTKHVPAPGRTPGTPTPGTKPGTPPTPGTTPGTPPTPAPAERGVRQHGVTPVLMWDDVPGLGCPSPAAPGPVCATPGLAG